MRSSYLLGRSRENNLKYGLIREGWLVFRMQGSAGGLPNSQVKPIDLVAIKKRRRPMFIQVSRHRSDITPDERLELMRLAGEYGGQATIAYIENRRWKLKPLSLKR